MHLIINGQNYDDLPNDLHIASLITHLRLSTQKIAVERNREIIPKSLFADTSLCSGDRLEIIHFIGGG